MFVLNDDLSIYVTRGDIVFFGVTAEDNGVPYTFKAGDVLRIKVYGKKDADTIALQKDFPVTEDTETVEILLDKDDTKIGGIISKPVDYWYEVELNPFTNPQTIIGYDEDGAKIFKLFPEGADIKEYEPTKEDIPFVDTELDMTSTRPLQNQAIARAIVQLKAAFEDTKEDITAKSDKTAAATADAQRDIAVERARIDNLVSGATPDGSEMIDIRVGADGVTYASAGTAIRSQFENITEKDLYLHGTKLFIGAEQGAFPYTDVNDFPCNSIIANGYVISSWMKNLPDPDFIGTFVTMSHSGVVSTGGALQLAFSNTGKEMYSRMRWANWSAWKRTLLGDIDVPNTKAVIPTGIHITESDKRYSSFNDFPANTIITLSAPLADSPTEEAYGTCMTFSFHTQDPTGSIQLFYSRHDNAMFVRSCWGADHIWDAWQKCIRPSDIEWLETKVKTLELAGENVPPLVASFLKIGCIGDSLASGECEYTKADGTRGYADLYEHSWGQFMARRFGVECVNFSVGGLTTKSYWEHSRGWASASKNLCNGYIIGLGQNDRGRLGEAYLGTIDDIDMANSDNNADTYYGNYAKIIQKIKGLQPNAKFFLLTDPVISIDHAYNNAVVEIANKLPGCYLLDLTKYAAMYNSGGFFAANKRGGHYNSIAYNYMGKIIGEEISKYMYENPTEFNQVEFIGTDYTV